MDDRRIIALFEARSEQAISKLSDKYGKLCLQVAQNILSSREDAMECVNDAYMALWNQIPPEKPIFLRAYLLKIVRNIAYDRLDQRKAAKRDDAVTVCLHELEDCLPAGDDLDAILDMVEGTRLHIAMPDACPPDAAPETAVAIAREWFGKYGHRQVTIAPEAEVEHCIIFNDCVVGEGASLKYVILDKDVTVTPGAKVCGTKEHPIVIKKGETV